MLHGSSRLTLTIHAAKVVRNLKSSFTCNCPLSEHNVHYGHYCVSNFSSAERKRKVHVCLTRTVCREILCRACISRLSFLRCSTVPPLSMMLLSKWSIFFFCHVYCARRRSEMQYHAIELCITKRNNNNDNNNNNDTHVGITRSHISCSVDIVSIVRKHRPAPFYTMDSASFCKLQRSHSCFAKSRRSSHVPTFGPSHALSRIPTRFPMSVNPISESLIEAFPLESRKRRSCRIEVFVWPG